MIRKSLRCNCLLLIGLISPAAVVHAEDIQQLEDRVESLRQELAEAEDALNRARQSSATQGVTASTELAEPPPEDPGFSIGPVTIGGAVRVNYVYGDYDNSNDPGPNRGGNGGNIELDTFRINLNLDYDAIIGKLEYRWYSADSGRSYNFLHTGWLGYRFSETEHVEIGVNRVPFGAGPYGISQSWFFDQHYYVGLADDPDLGVKYSNRSKPFSYDVAYYARNEPNFNGRSKDSTRYGYDAVRWDQSVDEDGEVSFGTGLNGYQEENQFNFRGIFHFESQQSESDIGVSLQYGELDGTAVDDGDHWAASGHAVHRRGPLTAAIQLSRYEFDIDADNPWGSDEFLPMGAYDFAWTVAARAWLPSVSVSYTIDTPGIPWLDYALPYLEWSSIIKDEGAFNDSELFIIGSAWAHGGWYIYSDLAYSNGNYFVGDKKDNYSRIDGVGDFGVTGNDKWNYRFNLNLGYYY